MPLFLVPVINLCLQTLHFYAQENDCWWTCQLYRNHLHRSSYLQILGWRSPRLHFDHRFHFNWRSSSCYSRHSWTSRVRWRYVNLRLLWNLELFQLEFGISHRTSWFPNLPMVQSTCHQSRCPWMVWISPSPHKLFKGTLEIFVWSKLQPLSQNPQNPREKGLMI